MWKFPRRLLVISIGLVLVGSLFAQTAKVKIFSISVVGNRTASPNVIIQNSGLRAGTEVNADTFGDAVRQLWNLGLFSDIKIIADQQTPDGLYVIISVEEFPRLDKVVLKSNKKLKKKDIEEKIKMYSGQVLSPAAVYEAQRMIRDMYLEKGYLLAKVTPTTFKGVKENTRGVQFEILENKKVKVYGIDFIGNQEVSDFKLRRKLEKIKQERWWKFWSEAEYSADNLHADEGKIVDYYKSLGYRDAEVLGDSVYYSKNLKHMFIDVHVYEGAKYKYGSVVITGNTIFPTDKLMKALDIKRGDVYDAEKLNEKIENNIRGAYMDRGYLYAQVNPVEIPVAADTVDLKIDIVEYNPVKIRQINIVGNDKTKENVIRRELLVFPGDQFSRSALMRSQREIMILNYFNNVTPDVIPVDNENIDLEFTVEEKQTGMATASAGYSQQDGLIGTVGMQFPNFLGNGQQLSFNLQRAYNYRSYSVSFTEPWLFDTPNLLGVSLFDTDRSLGNTSSLFSSQSSSSYTPYYMHSTGGSFTFGRRFRWPDNYFKGRWIFQAAKNNYDLNRVYDWSIFDVVNPRHLEKTGGLSLRQIITRDSRNAPEFPTGGSVLSLTTTYSGGLLGGNESYFKQEGNLEWFSPLGNDNITWRNYSELGYLSPLDKNPAHIIPYNEYFFMGGAGLIWGTSLRGYPERSVGPVYTSSSSWFGGKSLFKVTSELRFKLSPNPLLYLLVFAEAGNTWRDWDEINLYDLKRSVGIGGRIIMQPIGLLGIDLGWGFDRPSLGLPKASWKSPEVHFIFGQQF